MYTDTERVFGSRHDKRRNDSTAGRTRSGIRAAGRKPVRILIVEDHRDSREALRTLLEAFGYEVIEAVDGRQGVDLASAERPDLILMDIMMPELDGFEATRLLRQRGATRRVPIIAVTAMEGAQRLALAAGANDFVPKPVDTRRLLEKIDSWVPPGSGNEQRGGNGSSNDKHA